MKSVTFQYMAECVLENKQPIVTSEDGKAVLELIYAAYESARTGCKVKLPFYAKVSKPAELWKK